MRNNPGMRRVLSLGACGFSVLCIVAALPGADATTVRARPRAVQQAVALDRGLQLLLSAAVKRFEPSLHGPLPPGLRKVAPGTGVGVFRRPAVVRPSVCFVGSTSCPLTPCVVPVTAVLRLPSNRSSGSCPAGARRATPVAPPMSVRRLSGGNIASTVPTRNQALQRLSASFP